MTRGGRWRHRSFRCALLLVAWPACVSAQDDSDDGLFSIEMHGFVSQGFIYTTNNRFLAESDRGSFEFSEVGLNFTKQLTPNLRFGAQLFTRDLGPDGDYGAVFDWFYADYRFFDWFGLRAGRLKLPVGLYNETSDIDAARVPILLPQALYPARNRDYLLAQTGLEAYGYQPLGPIGAFDYRLYGGTIYFEPNRPPPNVEYSIPYVVGGRALWSTPIEGLSAAFSGLGLRLDQDALLTPDVVAILQENALLPPDHNGLITLTLRIRAWAASVEYAAHDLLLAAEYSRTHTDYESSEPQLDALIFQADGGKPPYPARAEAYYAMASYRVTSWFTPGAYYSVNKKLDLPPRRDRHTYDLAAFVRYDLNQHWLLKLEGHYMNGTSNLDARLNDLTNEDGQGDERQLHKLTRIWGAFLIKTTAYF